MSDGSREPVLTITVNKQLSDDEESYLRDVVQSTLLQINSRWQDELIRGIFEVEPIGLVRTIPPVPARRKADQDGGVKAAEFKFTDIKFGYAFLPTLDCSELSLRHAAEEIARCAVLRRLPSEKHEISSESFRR